jgi:acyl-CoA synthetase (AMP-forming)/AMP-acid ligase II
MPSPTTATLRSQLIDLAAMRPEKLCLFSPESQRAWAFSDFRHRTDEIARKLGGLGLHRGDKVAFLMDNGLFTSALLLGSMSGGFVAVPLNVRAGRSHLAYTLGHCDAKVVFASEEYRSLLEDLRGEIGRDLRIISADADRGPDWEAESVAEGALWEVAPDDDALLMYTSGSTGQPKGAVHTQRKVLAAAENSILAHSLTENDCSLCVLPLYHINAINVTLLPTLLTGGAVVMPQRFLVRSFWDWIGRYQCTWSALVPTIISQLIDWIDPRAEGMEEALRQIRFIRSSSAPLPPALHRAFEEKFRLPLIEAMGSTECGGNIFSNPPPPALDKIGTPGLPYGFQARIIGPDGADVPTGEPGEILLSGPGMMTGYYKNPEGTAAVLDSEGWLHTGDLAQRDEDGFFFIVGRSKELIIKGGMNIAPRQIDEALSGHPAVQDAAALGVPDPVFGEDIIAFAVLRSGFEVSERELLEHCESQVGLFKTPSQIFLVNDLPKGPSGKVQRLRMAECFHELISSRGVSARVPAERAPSKSAANGACGPLQEIISEMWAEVLEEEVSDKDANFFGLGGHSLLAIDALSRLRKRFGIDLSVNEFFTNPTVSGQAALVSERLFPAGQVPAQDRAGVEKWLLERKTGSAPDSIPHADPNRPAPLSEAQRRLRFLESLSPGLRAFNEPRLSKLIFPPFRRIGKQRSSIAC